MRAAVSRNGVIEVIDMADPKPAYGQVLAKTLACGICGSDLHALKDTAHFSQMAMRAGAGVSLDPSLDLVFGHEFCAEVLDFGPGTERKLPVGTRVCSIPIVVGPSGPEGIGYSHAFPGGMAELLLLQEPLLLEVPEHVDSVHASLAEPFAVGEHAAGASGAAPGDVCLVIGCGPVGLAVISALRHRGLGPIVAADFSATRRRLAELLGADQVIDPAKTSPYEHWTQLGVVNGIMERAAIEMVGGSTRDAVIFEAVGVPGVLQEIVDGAPPLSRIVVVGVCMDTDSIEPFIAIAKELTIRFSFGYSPAEFATTLQRIADGWLPADDIITSAVGLDEVADAFRSLEDPFAHGKIVVTHR